VKVEVLESMNWAKGGIVFFFAVMIAIWLAAVWLFLHFPETQFGSG
jgi:hypothetical protein